MGARGTLLVAPLSDEVAATPQILTPGGVQRAARRMVMLADHLQRSSDYPTTAYRSSSWVRGCNAASPRIAAFCKGDAAPAARSGPSAMSVERRRIRSRVYGSAADEAILILGGIHGNEPAGSTLCEALCDYLEQSTTLGEKDGKQVIVAPALNPDGLARNTRENARGIDLNRNFDTSNREAAREYGSAPLSEPESRFVAHLIAQFSPGAIVSVHQPLACVDYDGPAEELAAAMSLQCGLPIEKLANSKPYPGSLGTYVGVDLEIPIVTLELPANVSRWSKERLWNSYGAALVEAMRYTSGAARAD